MKQKAYFNWSGGKDSALTLHKVLQDKSLDVKCLVTTLSMEHKRISMHGVREELPDLQAQSIRIPLKKIWLPEMPSMGAYDETMKKEMSLLKNAGNVHAIFGDIFFGGS